MSSFPLRCVADASVAIKLFVLEAGSETADRLVGQLATAAYDACYVAPLPCESADRVTVSVTQRRPQLRRETPKAWPDRLPARWFGWRSR